MTLVLVWPIQAMTRAQRIVLIIYCLLVVYCCVWVPWVANYGSIKDIHQGYGWVWSPPSGTGVPSLVAIATRILAATALSGAAFLLAGEWKALLLVAVLAGAGILLHDYWKEGVAQRRTQRVHDCAVAKVATTARCTPPDKNGFEVCDNPTAQEEDAAIASAEKECAAEIGPKQKSAHEQIEEYRRQHAVKE
jgi:hypothetical protein